LPGPNTPAYLASIPKNLSFITFPLVGLEAERADADDVDDQRVPQDPPAAHPFHSGQGVAAGNVPGVVPCPYQADS